MAHTRFLRASSDHQQLNLDIRPISSGAVPAIEAGAELLALTDALTTDTVNPPTEARDRLVAVLGEAKAERAVGVAATFQMMNRLLDGTGAPVSRDLHPLARELGFDPDDIAR